MGWSTLIPVLVGGLLTLSGGLLGAWPGERRALAREDRAREHQQTLWVRNQRQDAYSRLFRVINDMSHQRLRSLDTREVPNNRPGELNEAVAVVAFIGTPDVVRRAARCSVDLAGVAVGAIDHPDAIRRVVESMHDLSQAMRLDLGITE